jgi:hypothetical protein
MILKGKSSQMSCIMHNAIKCRPVCRRVGPHRRELREKQIGKKEEKGQSKAFHGTVKKNLEPPYQEKRHATSEASYDDRRKFASNWEPG